MSVYGIVTFGYYDNCSRSTADGAFIVYPVSFEYIKNNFVIFSYKHTLLVDPKSPNCPLRPCVGSPIKMRRRAHTYDRSSQASFHASPEPREPTDRPSGRAGPVCAPGTRAYIFFTCSYGDTRVPSRPLGISYWKCETAYTHTHAPGFEPEFTISTITTVVTYREGARAYTADGGRSRLSCRYRVLTKRTRDRFISGLSYLFGLYRGFYPAAWSLVKKKSSCRRYRGHDDESSDSVFDRRVICKRKMVRPSLCSS